MNASPPLFPFDVSGQPAAVLAEPRPENGDNAFAEQLSAALAATTLATATPAQHREAPSGEMPGTDPIGGLRTSGQSAGSPASPFEGKPTAGTVAMPEPLDAGSAISSANADGTRPGDAVSGRGSAALFSPGEYGIIGQAGLDVMSDGFEGGRAEPTMNVMAGQNSDMSDRSLRNHALAGALGQAGNRDAAKPGSFHAAGEPVPGSPTPPLMTPSVTEPGHRQPAEALSAIETTNLQADGIFETGGMDEVTPSRQHERPAAASTAGKTSALGLSDRIEAGPYRNAEVAADISKASPASIADRPLSAQRQSEAPIRLAGVQTQGDYAQLTSGRPDIAMAARHSQGDRRSESMAAAPTASFFLQGARQAGETGHQSAPVSGGDRPARTSTAGIEQGSPSTTGIIPDGRSTPTAAGDVGLIQGAVPDSVERSQPVLPLDGLVRDLERLDSTTPVTSPRPQAPTAHPSAGAQVALQIVRSLPDGDDRLSVRLQPVDLGSVDIQLTFDGTGRLTALIAAERPETLELLQRDARFLERSLGDSGLKLSTDGLSFALKQDQQQQQQGQSFQQQAQAREAAFHTGRAYDGASDIEAAPPTQRIDKLRLLDIRT